MKNKRLTIIVSAVVAVAAIALIFLSYNHKDYSKHTFNFLENNFNWEMTKEEAAAYIEKNTVQPWREIQIKDDEVTDGMYSFDYNDEGKMYRVRYDLGEDPSIINKFVEWFGEYDKVEQSNRINYIGYIWYGKMAGEKTKAVVYTVKGSVHLHFVHVEREEQ